ncbi:MAE_28990/MAE_18760 family HEPN-like nuclease [Streptococcus salivarius]|jgi:hypothetical protein|uniref:MAE_28990/MAE_18760 family HEPN-like nuclease n=1 Tax=Streptococcus salivarius TaxID=1304 RepID=UPI000A092AD7|nr:MAE_28990/MAE_18760 family HEPN-like nuclease [Streptococcus salivarius]ARI57764.1 hypothetical protein NX99_04540 [Streptococcus salivarius]
MNDIKESLDKILDISVDSIIEEQNFLNLVLSDSPEGKILKKLPIFKDNGALYKLIFSVYATFEFTIKECCNTVLLTIDNNSLESLTDELQMLTFRQKLDELRKKIIEKREDNTVVKPLTDLHIKIKQQSKFNSNENMIDTKSNLNYDNFTEILEIFHFDKKKYKSYSILIDSIITYRNMIAHGNRKELTEMNIREHIPGNYKIITLQKKNNRLYFEDLCSGMINLLELFCQDLTDYVNEQKYFR